MEDLNPSYFKEIMVLGCGNILFGDDGFGYHVIEKLKNLLTEEEKKRVALVDAGTGAPQQVLSLIDETTKTKKIIVVDTIDYNLKPGEIKILRKEDLPDPKYSPLDIHSWPLAGILKDVCERYSIDLLVVGCQGKYIPKPDIHIGLSKEVEESVDKAVEIILKEIRKNKREG